MPVKSNGGGVIHRVASCMSCEWQEGYRRKAIAAARRHTEATGHKTTVETGTYRTYEKVK